MNESDRRDNAGSPRPLNRLEVLLALRLANYEAVLSAVYASLTTGAFQTGFALWLGAGTRLMGVIGAVPMLSALSQLPASYVTERVRVRKPLTAWGGFLGRLVWLPILLVPFVATRSLALALFVALLIVSSIVLQASTPPYVSWMADLVPPEHLGRYFGRRNMIAGLCAIVATLPMAWFVDLAVKHHRMPVPVGFAVPFGLAVICGIAGFVILMRPAEPPMAPATSALPSTFREVLSFYRVPFKDRAFRPYLVFSGLFALAQFFAAPFYTVYALQVLRLSYVTLQLMFAASALTSMLTMPLIGVLTDRYGNKPVLVLSVYIVSALPATWILCRPEHMTLALVLVFLLNFVGGAGWAGAALSQFNLMIAATPQERKSVYVGAVSAVTGLSGGIAPLIGAAVVTALRGHDFTVAGWPVDEYQATFGINSCLRLIALLSLRSFVEGSSARPQDVIAHLGQYRLGSVRQLWRLQSGTREDHRRNAVRALSGRHGVVAQSELIGALNDPSLHVRQEAALALGETRDPHATQALIECLEAPACLIELQAVEALGATEDRRARPVLERTVRHRDPRVAAASAVALSRIGDADAVPALMQRLEAAVAGGEVQVAQACAEALGEIGDSRAADALARLLRDGPATLRDAPATALGQIGGSDAEIALVDRLRVEREPVEIVHLAVAVAMKRETAAMATLLEAIGRIEEASARIVAVNATGVLAGLEDTLYPALAADDFARTATVARVLDEMSRDDPSLSDELAAGRADYLAGDFAAAARKLPPGGRRGAQGDPLRLLGAWAACAGEAGPFGAEEFLLALFAVRALQKAR